MAENVLHIFSCHALRAGAFENKRIPHTFMVLTIRRAGVSATLHI